MAETELELSARLVDLATRTIRPVHLRVKGRRVLSVEPISVAPELYVLPGFVDAHVHVESSLLPPAEFARIAATHGTVATISDPHEIANVLGLPGIRFMLEDAEGAAVRLYFAAPSCVPATPFETSGAHLGPAELSELLRDPRVVALAEVMNYPGVLARVPEVMEKLRLAQARGLPIDGHAPGLTGEAAARYASAGISTDHESTTIQEARAKLAAGMHVLIREGSAARNYAALHPLLDEQPERVMFCSDDKHPDDLVQGHIDVLVRRAIADGHDLFDVLLAASVNPVRHYRLDVGLLRPGDRADFIVARDLHDLRAERVYLDGLLVAEAGEPTRPHQPSEHPNRIAARKPTAADLEVVSSGAFIRVIEVFDGQLLTREAWAQPKLVGRRAEPDPGQDLLLLTVVNRYDPSARPAVAFARGFGLKEGALASSVAHDSHNIIAVGATRGDVARAIGAVIDAGGGLAIARGETLDVLPLPIAGLMSALDGHQCAARYQGIEARARAAGCPLRAPLMTLSFLALLVVPELKLSDRGLFSARSFELVPLFR